MQHPTLDADEFLAKLEARAIGLLIDIGASSPVMRLYAGYC